MTKYRIASTAALATFGLAALGGVALAAPGNADTAGSGRTSSIAASTDTRSGGDTGTQSSTTAPTSKLGSAPTSNLNSSGGAVTSTDRNLSSYGGSLAADESALNALMEQISNNPNPTQENLAALNALTQKYEAVVRSETGIVKTLGDMMKQVAMDIGS